MTTPKRPRAKPAKSQREIVYLPPGIYGSCLLAMMFPGKLYKIVITKDGLPPKRGKGKK